MTKGKLHHTWKRLRIISSWYFVAGLIISSLVAITALRNNNLRAIYLRDQVNQADVQNGDVESALRQLRSFVYSHMNTDLSSGPNAIKPPVQLKVRYERLAMAEKDRVSAINAKIYTDAQKTCEAQFPEGLSGRGRVPCIQDYVTQHGLKEQPIPDALYKFDFTSPSWSLDLAGWSIVFAALFGLLSIVRLSLEYWLHRYLREHA